MQNFVAKNRLMLKRSNYTLKADNIANDYWFNISQNMLNKYQLRTKGKFNIIIFGSVDLANDYYVLPYSHLKNLLKPEYLYRRENQIRWVGSIRNNRLEIRNCPISMNVREFYGMMQ